MTTKRIIILIHNAKNTGLKTRTIISPRLRAGVDKFNFNHKKSSINFFLDSRTIIGLAAIKIRR